MNEYKASNLFEALNFCITASSFGIMGGFPSSERQFDTLFTEVSKFSLKLSLEIESDMLCVVGEL